MKPPFSILALTCLVVFSGTAALADEHDPVAIAKGLAAAWDEAFNAGDVAAIGAMYAEDARLSPGDGRVLEGRAAIEELFQGFIDYGVNNHAIEVVDASGDGDMLYLIGRWSANGPEQDGNVPSFGGVLSNVFHKDGDGNWHSQLHVWNNNAE